MGVLEENFSHSFCYWVSKPMSLMLSARLTYGSEFHQIIESTGSCCPKGGTQLQQKQQPQLIVFFGGLITSGTFVYSNIASPFKWDRMDQSCLTFPTGTAQTQSKHHSMRGWKGMNTPCLTFCGWELDFWKVKPRTVLVECPLSPTFQKLVIISWC